MLSQKEILHRLDFGQLLTECGFPDVDETRSTFLSHCLFHHDERTKSFSANLDLKLFHCFSSACGVAGNGIHLYALHKGITYTEALAQLQERFDGEVRPRPLDLTVRHSNELEWSTRAEIYTRFWQLAQPLDLQPDVRDYLVARGFSTKFLEEKGIRAVVAEQCLPQLVETYGVRTLVQAGLLSSFSQSDRWLASFYSPAALFPFFLGDKVVYYQTRSLDPKAQPKYLNPTGYTAPCLYQHNALLAQESQVYIGEGPIDTLSLNVLGYSPAVGLLGTQSFQEEWIADFRCSSVVLCMDKDNAGELASLHIGKMLSEKGIKVYKWSPDTDVKDVNEFLQWKNKSVVKR